MPLTAEAQAALDQRTKEAEEAKAAYEEQQKAEAEAAEAEPGVKFIISASGTGDAQEALDAFDALVQTFDTLSGSIVIGSISYDASEFREKEEEAAPPPPTPTQLPASTAPKSEAKKG